MPLAFSGIMLSSEPVCGAQVGDVLFSLFDLQVLSALCSPALGTALSPWHHLAEPAPRCHSFGVTTGEAWASLCPHSKFSRFCWLSVNMSLCKLLTVPAPLDWFFSPFLEKSWLSVCYLILVFFKAYEVFYSLCISGFIPQVTPLNQLLSH